MRLRGAALALACMSSLANAQVPEGWDPILVDFSAEEPASIPRVSIPEAYELASIIVSLTPHGATLTAPSEYRDRVEKQFGSFRNHPLIAKLNIRTKEDWNTMYLMRENASAYCFDAKAANTLVHCQPYSHAWGRISNTFTQNIPLIEDFAEKSGFRRFYADNSAFYRELERDWAGAAPSTEMQQWLDRRFSKSKSHQVVMFSPLTGGWHSTQQFHDDGKSLVVMFIQPRLPGSTVKPYATARLLFTEIDHNYVNPVSEKYRSSLDSQAGFGGWFWAKENPGYRSGFSIFNEYMTFGVFELWALSHYPASMHQEIIDHVRSVMERRGFPHYGAFATELRRLDAARGRDKQIPALYPSLMSWSKFYRQSTEAAPASKGKP